MRMILAAGAAALLSGCAINIGNAEPRAAPATAAAVPASPGVAAPKERLPTDVRRAR